MPIANWIFQTITFKPADWISRMSGRHWFIGTVNGTLHGWLMYLQSEDYTAAPFPTDRNGDRLPCESESSSDAESPWESEPEQFGDVAAVNAENHDLPTLSTSRTSRFRQR